MLAVGRSRRYWLRPTLCLILGLGLVGCDREPAPIWVDLSQRFAGDQSEITLKDVEYGDKIYRFGFDLRASPQEDSRQYRSFLDYLEKTTGYTFRLHFVRKDQKIADQMGRGAVHFAAMGAVSSIQAQATYQSIPLVRGLNRDCKPNYRSMIVVAPHSPIVHLADLRGRRMAFGDVNSTQGHIIPRIMLREAGIDLQDLGSFVYTGSHLNCANEVIAGKADACGMQDTMAEALVQEDHLRILVASQEYPSSGITASHDLPPEVIGRVRQALLHFQPAGRDAVGLYHWDKTEMPCGFVTASPEDYADLRDWVRRFGLLGERQIGSGS